MKSPVWALGFIGLAFAVLTPFAACGSPPAPPEDAGVDACIAPDGGYCIFKHDAAD